MKSKTDHQTTCIFKICKQIHYIYIKTVVKVQKCPNSKNRGVIGRADIEDGNRGVIGCADAEGGKFGNVHTLLNRLKYNNGNI